MEKARRNKPTLKENNKSHRCKSATISRLDEEYDDQRDLSSTPITFLNAPEWIDYIPQFCSKRRLSDTVEKLCIAAAYKLRQFSMNIK